MLFPKKKQGKESWKKKKNTYIYVRCTVEPQQAVKITAFNKDTKCRLKKMKPFIQRLTLKWFEWPYKQGKFIKDSDTGWDFRRRPLIVAEARLTRCSYKKMYGRFAETKGHHCR